MQLTNLHLILLLMNFFLNHIPYFIDLFDTLSREDSVYGIHNKADKVKKIL